MDFQKIASTGTAVAVVGTGAMVGGNHVIDQKTGGPEKRESAKVELIREIVKEEVYLQLINAWPKTSGPVRGPQIPTQDYQNSIPKVK
tara:strand:+ start:22 stop:285 length:264 start_codon:yes stop_codon:yes gene_type:complete